MLNQKLTHKLQQRLSPQQIQLMKLLQIPTANLEQRIKEELELNPALEEGKVGEEEKTEENANDDIDVSEYIDDDGFDVPDYKLRANNYSASADDDKTIPIAVIDTFHDNLKQQLGLLKLDDKSTKIAKQIIGSIDDDGYLRRDLRAIVNDLAFTQNVMTNEEEVEHIIKKVQTFEPAGVAARTVEECLLLQIDRKEIDTGSSLELARKLLTTHFEPFHKKHYEKLLRQLNLNEEELREGIAEIQRLNPKPGGGFASGQRSDRYVIPDFILNNDNGELKLTLNSRNAPELNVSNGYKDMLRDYNKNKNVNREQKDAVRFIKNKIDSAKWFIDAIRQRQQTMMNTMRAILDYQYAYFLTGDDLRLKPMILKDIADITHLDISTISRVANSKYIQTEFGTFQLKSFFSESLQTESGEEVSTREVKKILETLIDNESKRKPLSDQKLTDALIAKGYNIARRTVAKYREQLNIPVARLRKEL